MIKIPFGLNIHNLIDDLRNFSWEAAEILLYYSSSLKSSENKNQIIKTKLNEDPVTLADLKVNELIIQRLNERYKDANWDILSEENVKLGVDIRKQESEWQWVIDPLDGTKDFIQGTGNYAMHLALNYRQKPIIGVVLIPERDELWISYDNTIRCEKSNGSLREIFIPREKNLEEMTFVSSKNHRNNTLEDLVKKINFKKIIVMGSIGCKIASIVRGESDIYISLSLQGQGCPKDWDFAAPEAILKAAGGAITDLYNHELIYNKKNFEQRGIIIATSNRNTHEVTCNQIRDIIRKFNVFPLDT